MFQRLIYAIAAFCAVACAGGAAEAAKVPIPCTSQKVVKVLELPMTEAFATQTGQHVDLGYLHDGCFSGKWVGYVDGGNRYVTFRPEGFAMALQTLGMTEPPSPPSVLTGLIRVPGQFWVEWVWIVALGCIGVSVVVSERSKRNASALPGEHEATATPPPGEQVPAQAVPGTPAFQTRAPRVPRADIAQAALPLASPRSAPVSPARSVRRAANPAPDAQRPVFGRKA